MKNAISISILTAISCTTFALLNKKDPVKGDDVINKFCLKDSSGKIVDYVTSDLYGNLRLKGNSVGMYTLESYSDSSFKPLKIYLDTAINTYQFLQVYDYLNQNTYSTVGRTAMISSTKVKSKSIVTKRITEIESMVESKAIDGVAIRGSLKDMSKKMMTDELTTEDITSEIKTTEKEAKSGVMTAGLWNDLDNWTKFNTTLKENSAQWKPWGLNLINKRFSIELLDKSSERNPIIGAKIRLIDPVTDSVIWLAQTDNRGICELWGELNTESIDLDKEYIAQWVHNAENIEKLGLVAPTQDVKETFLVKPVSNPSNVEISFIVDATGSMGDEISYLKEELMDLMLDIQEKLPCSNVRLSSVFYRDNSDAYVTKKTEFTEHVEDVVNFVSNQYAGGGGDFPEAVDAGLQVCLEELDWSEKALAKIAFLILDAPPHSEKAAEIQRLAKVASSKGIKIIPVVASGINKTTEFLMKELAAVTSGDYIYITDHSGVGGSHIKPTGVKEDVDLLKNQFAKVIVKYTKNKDCDLKNKIEREQRITVFGDQEVLLQTFPNPATEYIDVRASHEIEEISLFSISGNKISTTIYNDGELMQRFVIDKISRGLYVLKVKVKGQIYSQQILILESNNSIRRD